MHRKPLEGSPPLTGDAPTVLRSPFAHAVKVSTATEAPPEAKEVL